MSESLRRSTRRGKKRATYSTGDIVEITRANSSLAHARLIIKHSDDPPKWLVSFDKGSSKDEEVSEDLFGSVVGKHEGTEGSPKVVESPPPGNRKAKKKSKNKHVVASSNKGVDFKASNNGGTSASSSAEEQTGNTEASISKKKKSVSFSPEGHPTESDASTHRESTKKARASARYNVSDREQRSRRRQAMIEEEAQTTSIKRPRPHSTTNHGVAKKIKAGTNEEVIKVPMLTGTLYLYRGLRRRAEFVRKY